MMTITQFIAQLDAILKENELLRKRVEELERQPGDNRPKLTPLEVNDIRDAYRMGMKQRDLADNYGVNPATISRTVRGIYH